MGNPYSHGIKWCPFMGKRDVAQGGQATMCIEWDCAVWLPSVHCCGLIPPSVVRVSTERPHPETQGRHG